MRKSRYRTALPSQDYLHRIFDYDAATGQLIWRRREDRRDNWNAVWPGRVAGTLRNDGYICVNIDRKQYAAHRIIWKWVSGDDPVEEIDHVDGVKTNNRFLNLRGATFAENRQNSASRGPFKKGVYQNRHGAFVAQIKQEDKHWYLGCFTSESEAHAAYAGAARVLFGDFTCLHR